MGLTLGAPEAWAFPVTPFANLVMEYHINGEIYTSYVGAARMQRRIQRGAHPVRPPPPLNWKKYNFVCVKSSSSSFLSSS